MIIAIIKIIDSNFIKLIRELYTNIINHFEKYLNMNTQIIKKKSETT